MEIIKIPIYNIKIGLVICEDIEDYCEEHFGTRPATKCRAKLFNFLKEEDTISDFLLLLRQDDLKENVINHEAFHLTYQILKYIGIILSDKSEEAFAYLNDYIYLIIRSKTIKWKTEQNSTEDGNTNSSKEV